MPSPVYSVELDRLLQDSEIFLSKFLKQNFLNRVVFYFDDEPHAKCGKFTLYNNIYCAARMVTKFFINISGFLIGYQGNNIFFFKKHDAIFFW